MYLSGKLLCLHCDVGAPTFSLESFKNVSTSIVLFLPSMEDYGRVTASTLPHVCSSTCGLSTPCGISSLGSSFGARNPCSGGILNSHSREHIIDFSSLNLSYLLKNVIRSEGKYTLQLCGVSVYLTKTPNSDVGLSFFLKSLET